MPLVVAVLFCLLVLPATATAAPPDRAAAVEAYLSMLDAANVPAGWTGSVDGCVVGTEAPASIEATRATLNRLRDFAGAGPVAFDAGLDRKALAAALMMRAAGALDHSPGPGWPCYSSEGAEGAGRSNLFLGRSGAAAMVGYVDDAGVDSLGHRRWALDPTAATFGTGSTGTTNALLVVGGPGAGTTAPEVLAWPPAGHVPWPLVFEDWSAAITVPGTVDLSAATVAVTVDGEPAPVVGVRELPEGYGTGPALTWQLPVPDGAREASHVVDVSISGVLVDGAPWSTAYTFEAVPVLPPLSRGFDAERTAETVSVSWAAAQERGAPLTGYRIVAAEIGSGAVVFDQTAGPEATGTTFTHARADQPLVVSVVPLSRAGSPAVDPIVVPAVVATGGGPGGGDGGGSGPGGGGPSGSALLDPRLEVTRIRLRGRRLRVAARVRRAATGRIRVRLHAAGRTRVHRRKIAGGRAKLVLRLKRPYRRSRPLRVIVAYPGDATFAPARVAYVFSAG